MNNIIHNSSHNANNFNQVQNPTTSFYGNGYTSVNTSGYLYPTANNSNSQVNQHQMNNIIHNSSHNANDFNQVQNPTTSFYGNGYTPTNIATYNQYSTNSNQYSKNSTYVPSSNPTLSNINRVSNKASNINATTPSLSKNSSTKSIKEKSVKTTKSKNDKTNNLINYTVEAHSNMDFVVKFLANFRDNGAAIDKENNSMQLYYFIEEIIKTLCSVRSSLNYSPYANQLKHDIKHQIPRIIKHYQHIGFLPKDSDNASKIDVMNHIFNFISSNISSSNSNVISNTSSSISNSKSKTISPSAGNIGGGPTDISGPIIQSSSSSPQSNNEIIQQSKMKFNHTVPLSNGRKRKVISIVGSIDIMETIIKFLKHNSSCNLQLLKGLEIFRSVQIFKQFGFLLFEDINTHYYDILYGNDELKIHDTLFSCLSEKLKVNVYQIATTIIEYINNNRNDESFLSTICKRNDDSNDIILQLDRNSKLDFYLGEISTHRISEMTLPFLFIHFKFIFPDHNVILFKYETDKIVEVNYHENTNIHNFDFTDANAVVMIRYNDIYKLLYCMDPSYLITSDTDDEDN
jgi:hypothetical protein